MLYLNLSGHNIFKKRFGTSPEKHCLTADLKDAYFTIPIHKEHQKYFKFMWKIPYKFIAMPNSYGPAMLKFRKIMKPPFSELRKKGHQSVVFVYDTYLQSQTFEECEENVKNVKKKKLSWHILGIWWYSYSFFSTVIVVVVVIFISAAFGGKQSKGTLSTRRSDPNSTNVLSDAATDSQKTLAEWLQLPKESLVLRCSNLHLVSRGSVNILANHLFTYYHSPAALSTAALPSSNNISVPSTVPPVISTGDTGTISDIVRLELRAIFSSGDFTDMLSLMPTTTRTGLDSPAVDLTYNGRQLRSQNVQTPLVFSSPQPAMPTHHLLSNQRQPTSSRLPALPSTVLKKIQAGQFVNFNDLLPHSMSPSTSDDFTIQLSQSSATNPTSLSLVPRSQSSRAKVYDFSSWLQAWNNFCEQLYITILCS